MFACFKNIPYATLTLLCINGESHRNIFVYQSQRILANFMRSLGLRRTRCTFEVSVTFLWRLYDECGVFYSILLRTSCDNTPFNSCGIVTTVFKYLAVILRPGPIACRYQVFCLANLGLLLCRSSSNVAGSIRTKFLNGSLSSSCNSLP